MQTASIASATTTARMLSLPLLPRHTAFSSRPRRISCDIAVSSLEVTSSAAGTTSDSSSPSSSFSCEEMEALGKVGARVRVKVPLTVYHVPRVQELQLEGMEGVVKQYVVVWKEKRISANLPFKVEFVVEGGVEERPGTFKFFAHFGEDEIELL